MKGDVRLSELTHTWWMLCNGGEVERAHMVVHDTHEFAREHMDGKFQQDPDSNNPHKSLSKLAFQESLVMEGLQTSISK